MILSEAFDAIEKAIKNDPEYAYTLFCNIVMPFRDAGASRELAHEGAARVMDLWFKYDSRKHENYDPQTKQL